MRRIVKNAAPGQRSSRATREGETMDVRILLALILGGLLVVGGAPAALAADKDTLVIALDTLGAQVMDPIMETRAPHAHHQAPVWDSVVRFDFDKGGIVPGSARSL